MLIETVRYPTLYTSRAAQRRVQCRPNFQPGSENFRIRPRRSEAGTRPSKIGRLGGCGQSAHSIFRLIPGQMSARAQVKSIETCSTGQEMPCTWRPAGRGGGLRDLPARWRATGRTMYVVFLSAPSAGQRQ